MILAGASPVTLALSLGSAAAYALLASGWIGNRTLLARTGATLALILHALVIGWGLWGAVPKFGFAPALSVTAWLVGAVYRAESWIYPQITTPKFVHAAGVIVVLLALLFPGATPHPALSPMMPLHWALGIASYGLFAVAVVHAIVLGRAEDRIRHAADPQGGLPLLTLERMVFRLVGLGFALLTLTLVAGAYFAHLATGPQSAVRLDHKTIFSVLSWLTFAGLLIGRWRYGWRGRPAVRVLYIGALLLLLSYAGSRFVMEVILGRAA